MVLFSVMSGENLPPQHESKPDLDKIPLALNVPELVWLSERITENKHFLTIMENAFFHRGKEPDEYKSFIKALNEKINKCPVGSEKWCGLIYLKFKLHRTARLFGEDYDRLVQTMRENAVSFALFPRLTYLIVRELDERPVESDFFDSNYYFYVYGHQLQGKNGFPCHEGDRGLLDFWLSLYLTSPELSEFERPAEVKLYSRPGLLRSLYQKIRPDIRDSFAFLYRASLIGDDPDLKTWNAERILTAKGFSEAGRQIRENIYLQLISDSSDAETKISYCKKLMDETGYGYAPLLETLFRIVQGNEQISEEIRRTEKLFPSLSTEIRKTVSDNYLAGRGIAVARHSAGYSKQSAACQKEIDAYIHFLALQSLKKKNTNTHYEKSFALYLNEALKCHACSARGALALYSFLTFKMKQPLNAEKYLVDYIHADAVSLREKIPVLFFLMTASKMPLNVNLLKNMFDPSANFPFFEKYSAEYYMLRFLQSKLKSKISGAD